MIKIIKLYLPILLILMITSCASKRSRVEPLAFPADLNQPFLTLEATLGEINAPTKGLLKRLMFKIVGRGESVSLLRPVAVDFNDAGDVFVIDADAAYAVYYQYEAGELKNTEIFGAGILKAPQGIALSEDVIYVSDAEANLIHRFDHKFNMLDPLKIEGLQRPGQISINPHTGELFIVDTPGHQIIVVDEQGKTVTILNNAEIGRHILKSPIAVDFTLNGEIVILDGMTRRVEFLTPTYQYRSGFGDYDMVPGSFSYPRGLTISSDGYVFVSDAAFGNVQIFDPKGALLYFFGETGKADGEFLLPAALNFDANDNLYVADQYNGRVQVYHYRAQEK